MHVTAACAEISDKTNIATHLATDPTVFDGILSKEVNEKMQSFSMSNHLIMKEAERRGWKTKILNHEKHLIVLLPSNSDRPILLRRTSSELNTALGHVIANDKMLTYTIAADAGIPTPASLLLTPDGEGFTAELLAFLRTHRHIVVKPVDCSLGIGVSTNVTDETSLRVAIDHAKKFSKNIMIQSYATGDDHRLLVLNGRVIAATRRCPPFVIGDGIKTIQQLIEIENAQPSRGSPRLKPLQPIDSDEVKSYVGIDRMNSVPDPGQEVQLLGVANGARGGIPYDVTQLIHPSISRLAEKMTDAAYLSLCGVDMIISGDASKPVGSGCQPVVIEINATPRIQLHHCPAVGGHPRNVAAAILDEIIRRRAVARKITTEGNIPTSTNKNLTSETDDGEHFAEIISDPEAFMPLSVGESDFYVNDAVH